MENTTVARAEIRDEEAGIVDLYNDTDELLATITDKAGFGLESIRVGINTITARIDERA